MYDSKGLFFFTSSDLQVSIVKMWYSVVANQLKNTGIKWVVLAMVPWLITKPL